MRKPATRKSTAKRKPARKSPLKRLGTYFLWLILLAFFIAVVYHYRNGLAYYLGFKSDKLLRKEVSAEEKRLIDVRNYELLTKYQDNAIGFDVSHYQGEINWDKVKYVEESFPLNFVFIRATAGKDLTDACFNYNWKEAGRTKMLRGAYHYYRPDENSMEQAENFIKTVKLSKGDLPPVVDLEKLPAGQSIADLKRGLRKFLDKVETHYHVTPIIYTGEKYYNNFLRDEFSDYTFWIANYNLFVEDICDDWLFWQFTESAYVEGIPTNVDINIYNGTAGDLQKLKIH